MLVDITGKIHTSPALCPLLKEIDIRVKRPKLLCPRPQQPYAWSYHMPGVAPTTPPPVLTSRPETESRRDPTLKEKAEPQPLQDTEGKVATNPPPQTHGRGMCNIGNTCFLNATIQCLWAIDEVHHAALSTQATTTTQDELFRCIRKLQQPGTAYTHPGFPSSNAFYWVLLLRIVNIVIFNHLCTLDTCTRKLDFTQYTENVARHTCVVISVCSPNILLTQHSSCRAPDWLWGEGGVWERLSKSVNYTRSLGARRALS